MNRIEHDLYYDFETFWTAGYSLRATPTILYVRDEQFEAHCAAFRSRTLFGDDKTIYVPQGDLTRFIHELPWDSINAIAHNNYFDALILWERYNRRPGRYSCTLSMARALFPHFKNRDLDSLSSALGGRGKADVDLAKITRGKRTEDLTAEDHELLEIYTIQDVDELAFVYQKMVGAFPEDELELISQTLRWGCLPTLQVDRTRMKAALDAESEERNAKIKASGTTKTTLGSNPKFADYLKGLGIEPPMKPKKKQGEVVLDDKDRPVLTYAFSKDDAGFQKMQADNPEHADLFTGRIACKSLGNIRRMERFLELSKKTNTTPMPLNYFGAHTGRWSGSDKLNVQNLTRGSEMRKSLIAPPGYQILVVDLSQIELRMNFWFCDAQNWLDIIRKSDEDPNANPDVYKVSAAKHYGVDPLSITEEQRFFGKVMELGLGYRMGAKTFRNRCATDSWNPLFLSENEAFEAVNGYRASHPEIPLMWDRLDNMLYLMMCGGEDEIKGVRFMKDCVMLPNNMPLMYDDLKYVEEKGSIMYNGGQYYKFMHGGTFLENIIQAISRIKMGEIMLEVERDRGDEIFSVSTTHDEGLWLVKEDIAEEAYQYVLSVMRKSPSWAPDCPMNAEGGYAREYSK